LAVTMISTRFDIQIHPQSQNLQVPQILGRRGLDFPRRAMPPLAQGVEEFGVF
jgi:hypothetical protein